MRPFPVRLWINNFRRTSYVATGFQNLLAATTLQRHYYSVCKGDREASKREALIKKSLVTQRFVSAAARFDSHPRFFCSNSQVKMTAVDAVSKVFERLPKSVVPVHYEITIKPDLVKLVFEGTQSVTLKVGLTLML